MIHPQLNLATGIRIPAGATIVANVWGMLRDPEVYEDPDLFKPSKYMGLNEAPNPEDVAFGFGRRLVHVHIFGNYEGLFVLIWCA